MEVNRHMSLNKEKVRISKIIAREILDSRGNPTVEVEVFTKGGAWGRADAPSGASTGFHEALELRDEDKKRYRGKGVLKAIENIREKIAPEILGMDVREQRAIDQAMIMLDATPNKSNLGSNAIFSVSLAVAKAASNALNLPLFSYLGGDKACVLPVPLMNIINGGKHADNELKIQEFQIIPVGAPSYSEALRMGVEIYHALKDVLKKKYGSLATNVGDEGGYSPPMKYTSDAFEAILKAISEAGYKPGEEIVLAIDSAASSFYEDATKKYVVDGKSFTGDELLDFYKQLASTYPLRSIEDPLHEDDFAGFVALTKELRGKVQIIGDDIFVTNINRLKKGVEMGAANVLLMKVNQVGTISEAIDATKFALDHGYGVVISHRSGETEDTAIADLAVAFNTGQIKTGAPARSERTAKYNQLLRIEEYLGEKAKFLGLKALKAA